MMRGVALLEADQRGRSLIELVMVLIIVGIVSALAIPSYRDMVARYQLRSAATEIASQLRTARQLAMARRERLRVRVDLQQRLLSLERADRGEVLEVYRYGDKGVMLAEPTAGSDILFHPSGRSATATTIEIAHGRGLKTKLSINIAGRVSIS